MIGNGNGGFDSGLIEQVVRTDPNVKRAIQHAQDLAPNLIGISIVVVTKDGNSAKITYMPPDPSIVEKAIAQHLTALLGLTSLLGQMSQEVQQNAPPVGKILRPPPIMG